MPHFVIDCSENLLKSHSQEEIIKQVHISAVSTKLFHKGDVKVRLHLFKEYTTVDEDGDANVGFDLQSYQQNRYKNTEELREQLESQLKVYYGKLIT